MGLEDVEGSVMGYCEHSTELVGSVVRRNFWVAETLSAEE
jgi:hypothetical protein